jgi:Tfp pilus assembly protein PilP
MNFTRSLTISFLLVSILLVSCKNDSLTKVQHNLEIQKIEIAKEPKSTAKGITLQPVKAVTYQSTSLRIPFEGAEALHTPKEATPSLSTYPLNVLRFVGTIMEDKGTWAVIATPDDHVYRVTLGDKISDNQNVIISIHQDQIELLEQEKNKAGSIKQRIVVLKMKDR